VFLLCALCGAIFLSFGFDNTERLVRRRKGYCKKAV